MENSTKNNVVSINVTNISELCLACLGSQKTMNLFDLSYDGNLLSDLFEKCTNIQIDKNNTETSNLLCEGCVADTIMVYTFLKKCRDTNELINNLLTCKKNMHILIDENQIKDESISTLEDTEIANKPVDDNPEESNLPNVLTETVEIFSDEEEDIQNEVISAAMPFECTVCKEGFLQNSSLEQHIKVAHDAIKSSICPQCGKFFKNLNRHMQIHSNAIFTCTVCKKQVSSKESLRLHSLCHKKHMNCKICNKAFTQLKSLEDHMNVHTGERPYRCDVCGNCFKHRNNLSYHAKLHQGLKQYVCDICGKPFSQKAHMVAHRNVHSNEYPFSCEHCDKKFKWEKTFKRHMCSEKIAMYLEKTESSFNFCKKCIKHFPDSGSYATHMKEFHTEITEDDDPETIIKRKAEFSIKERTCKICEQIFSSKSTLSDHIKIHTGDKPYSCKICDKAFIQKSNLKFHIQKHMGEVNFTCKYCSKGFRTSSSFKEHMHIHEPPGEPLECEKCHKLMRSQQALRRHMLAHEKRFLCVECGKSFGNNTHLTDHMNIHKGIRPFKCDKCPKSFYKKHLLNNHLKMHGGTRLWHSCKYCDKSYVEKTKFLLHVQKKHPEELESENYLMDSYVTDFISN